MSANLSANLNDRRIERTRQALSSALFRLIASRDWQEINVSRLSQEAKVARSTFYLHYASPTELLDEMIATIVSSFAADGSSTIPVLEWLVDHIAANRAVFQRTVTGSRTSFVIDRFKAGIMEAFANEQGLGADRPATIRTAMVIGGAFQALQLWSKNWDHAEIPQLKAEIRQLEYFAFERAQ